MEESEEGGKSRGQPRARRKSAEPEVEVAARLPCCKMKTEMRSWRASAQGRGPERTLQTMAPAPAATIAALVETLNVSWPSPPVPTMSTTVWSSPS